MSDKRRMLDGSIAARPQPNGATTRMRAVARFVLLAGLLTQSQSLVHAGTWVTFGPRTFQRGLATPTIATTDFNIPNLDTTYMLRIDNGGLDGRPQPATGSVTLNGKLVAAFAKTTTVVTTPVGLLAANHLQVILTGAPGGRIVVRILGVDNDPPSIAATVTPAPNASGWNTSAVSVSFACADALSGLASCSAPVAVTTEGADQVVTGTAVDLAGNVATAQASVNISTRFFSLRNYAGKCLDFGPPPQPAGSPVFLNDCNGTEAQQVRLEEVDDRHDVRLFAGILVIGVHNPLVKLAIPVLPPPLEYALELQVPADPGTSSFADQVFGLDGDSVILAADHAHVFQVENGKGSNRTPVVAGRRTLGDAEFWDFIALDGTDKDPTSGFVRITQLGSPENPDTAPRDGLLYYLHPNGNHVPSPAGPGTVLVLAPDATIDLTGWNSLLIPAGVTIRGDRRGTRLGPLVKTDHGFDPTQTTVLLDVAGDDVRITGLRLQGTSRSSAMGQPGSIAITTHDGDRVRYFDTLIDHNDISGWTMNGVKVGGDDAFDAATRTLYASCDPADDPYTRSMNVRVMRNFIHHNRMEDFGYGVESNFGGFPLVEGITFLYNRHAIAAGYGSAHSGYRAWLNLVLSGAPLQMGGLGGLVPDFYTHDFDMHGDVFGTNNGFGGQGGDYIDLYENTFLGTNRHAYELRGQPCHFTDVHFNVSLQSDEDTLRFKDSNSQIGNRIEYMNIADSPGQFGHSNPTYRLGVGDFDGDGVQDVFLATGTAWYFAPAANAEWRYLNFGKTDSLDSLLFGDFDGDGRTDVIGMNGTDLMVSWGGVSDWEVLNAGLATFPPGVSIHDLAVGNFVDDVSGDRRDDLFWADGSTWRVSSGGSAVFIDVNSSSFRVPDLRFGDFDGDGKTDVFGVVSNGQFDTWSISRSAAGAWADGYLRPALAPIAQLVVADFDGDGRADVALPSTPEFVPLPDLSGGFIAGWTWSISYGGVLDWASHRVAPNSGCVLEYTVQQLQSQAGPLAAVGRFAGDGGADLLFWGGQSEKTDFGNNFCIAPQVTGELQRQSRQDMR